MVHACMPDAALKSDSWRIAEKKGMALALQTPELRPPRSFSHTFLHDNLYAVPPLLSQLHYSRGTTTHCESLHPQAVTE